MTSNAINKVLPSSLWRTEGQPVRLIVSLMALGSLWAEAGSFGARAYPHVPLLPGFVLPTNLELGFWVVLCVCCFGFGTTPAWRVYGMVFIGLFALTVMADVNRLSPYWFNYLCLGGVLYFRHSDDHDTDDWLRPTLVILGVQYLWAGINKANPAYLHGGFLWFTEPYFEPTKTPAWLITALFFTPLIEMALGVGLFFRQSTMYATWLGVVMHAVLVIVLGPLGRSWGAGIWPWNLGLMAFLIVGALKLRNPNEIWRPLQRRELVFVLVLAIVPVFNLFGNGLYFASYRMYTNNETSGMLYLEEGLNASVDRWRDSVAVEHGRRVSKIRLAFWAVMSGTQNVYFEAPILKKAFFSLCPANRSQIARLKITPRWMWTGKVRPEIIVCPGKP
jgi:hypothetical protein